MALILASIVGIIYSYIVYYNPIAGYLSIIVTAAGGACFGATSYLAVRVGHCRNTLVAGLIGLLVTLWGYYVSWAFFEAIIYSSDEESVSGIELLAHPDAIFAIAKAIAETGWFTLKGKAVSGLFLWACWAIEAIIIIAIGSLGGLFAVNTTYCESCSAWADDEIAKVKFAMPPAGSPKLPDNDLNFELLATLGPAPLGAGKALLLEVEGCKNCDKTRIVKLEKVTESIDSEGKTETNTESILSKHLLEFDELDKILALKSRPGLQNAPAEEGASAEELESAEPA